MKRLALFAVVLIGSAILASPASALSKNNNGATLNISPGQPVLGDTVMFSGCNYQPNWAFVLTVQANNRSGAYVFDATMYTNSSGCFAGLEFAPPSVGDWYAAVWFGNGHKVASLNLSVSG